MPWALPRAQGTLPLPLHPFAGSPLHPRADPCLQFDSMAIMTMLSFCKHKEPRHSPLGRRGKRFLSPPLCECFREKSSRGFGLYFLAEISTRRYAPLTFPPLPVTIRVDGDGVLDTVPAAENIVTTVTHRHALSGSYRKTIFRPSCVLLFQ